jgi:glycosyltransferase 2 family protein
VSNPRSSRRSKAIQILLGIAVSVLCLWWAVRGMLQDPNAWPQVKAAFATADYSKLIPFWIALFLFYWLKAWRWRMLLAPIGRFRPMKELFPPTLIGFAFNNLLPAHLGEFVRVFVFSRQQRIAKTAVLSTVVLERVFDVLAIVAFLGLGLVFVKGVDPRVQQVGMIGGVGAAVLVLGALGFVIWTKPVLAITEAILHRLPLVPKTLVGKLTGLLETAAEGLASLRSPALLAGILLTSLAQWALNGWMMHLSLEAFGLDVTIWVSCILLGAVAFAVTIPSSPGYFGVIQFTFMGVLQLFTKDQPTVFAASVVYHLAQYIPVTLAGLYFFALTGLKMSQVQDAAEVTSTATLPAEPTAAG